MLNQTQLLFMACLSAFVIGGFSAVKKYLFFSLGGSLTLLLLFYSGNNEEACLNITEKARGRSEKKHVIPLP